MTVGCCLEGTLSLGSFNYSDSIEGIQYVSFATCPCSPNIGSSLFRPTFFSGTWACGNPERESTTCFNRPASYNLIVELHESATPLHEDHLETVLVHYPSQCDVIGEDLKRCTLYSIARGVDSHTTPEHFFSVLEYCNSSFPIVYANAQKCPTGWSGLIPAPASIPPPQQNFSCPCR